MCNESMDMFALFNRFLFRLFRKKPFEKFVDLMKGIERPTIHELGSEFLRIFDGRFNYREGHVVRRFD